MKETWKKPGSLKIKIERDEPPPSATEIVSQCEILRLMIFYALLIACITTASYVSWRLYCYDATATTIYLTRDEFRAVMRKIVGEDDEFDRLFAGKVGKSEYVGEVRILDAGWNVLWKWSLNEDGLRSLKIDGNEKYGGALPSLVEALPHPRRPRSADEPPAPRRKKSYVVSHGTQQYVPCDRFKPVRRGRYLVSPSLHALHHCYRHGVRWAELRRGVQRYEGDALRYDLGQLYVECAEVFDDRVDELTEPLRRDYERCKWSGALDEQQQELIETRFRETFDADAPSKPTAAPRLPRASHQQPSYDPRTFVQCSRFGTDDYSEPPSPEILERCRDHGVTLRGVAAGVRDPDGLYLPCQEVFEVPLEYVTAELKADYGRCKELGAVSGEVQRMVEKRLQDTLYATVDDTTTLRNPASSPPRSSAEDTESNVEATTMISFNDERLSEAFTTTSSGERRHYAYDKCRRVGGESYLICFKVVKVHPMQMTDRTV